MIRNSHYQTEELLSLEIKTTPNNEHNKTLNEFIFMVLKKIHFKGDKFLLICQ